MPTQLAFLGDSLTQGTQGSVSVAQNGSGCWVETVAERLANLPSVGPLLSSGFRGTWLGLLAGGDTEWAFTAGWSVVNSTDAWDKLFGQGHVASTQAAVATATLPSLYRTAVGFTVYYMDYTSGGNWQLSTNSGSTWSNMGQTIANDNGLKKFYVSTAISPGGTVQFRGFNGTSNCGIALAGIEWFYAAVTSSTPGLIVHNLGINGWKLNLNCQSTSGDRLAWFDSVTLGTGAPISNKPSLVFNMNINDVQLASVTQYNTDLGTLDTRLAVTNAIQLVIMNPYEANTTTYNQAQQTAYRAQAVTSAALFATPVTVIDLFALLNSNGISTNVATGAAGYLLADFVHESQLGHFYITYMVYWYLRTTILGIGSSLSLYAGKASQVVPAFKASRVTPAYTAGPLLGLGGT